MFDTLAFTFQNYECRLELQFTPISRLCPWRELKCLRLSPPEMDSVMVRSRHDTHSAGDSVKSGMPQETARVVGGILGPDIQPKHAIGWMAELAPEKILILGNERDLPMPVQQWDNVIVLDPEMPRMGANLPERNSPGAKQGPLVIREVLVQQVQAGASSACLENGGRASRPRLSSQDCRDSLTASPTAAREIRPPQRVPQIKSHDRPSATSSSTCQTMMRVPLKVGLPWQISGSATMHWPSSTRSETPCAAWFSPFFILKNSVTCSLSFGKTVKPRLKISGKCQGPTESGPPVWLARRKSVSRCAQAGSVLG